MLFSSYENVSHTYLCSVPVLNSILRWRSQMLQRPPLAGHLGTSAQARWPWIPIWEPRTAPWHLGIPRPQSSRIPCTKGRVTVGTHTHPLRQSWWQEPQHQGCSPCLSYVGLSFTRAHYCYCIAFTLYFWFTLILLHYYCTMHILFVYIYMNASSFVLPHFELSNKV